MDSTTDLTLDAVIGDRHQGRRAATRLSSAEQARPRVVRLVRPWTPPTADEKTRTRILTSLAGGSPRWGGSRGRWSWGKLRQSVGGAVGAEQFRRLVDTLLEDGLVLEIYEAAGDRRTDRRTPKHLLVVPEKWQDHEWGDLIEVRGQEDVLERLGLLRSDATPAPKQPPA